MAGSALLKGHALQVGEKRKMAAHQDECTVAGVAFIPLIVESLGGWSQKGLEVITKLGRLQALRSGTPLADSTRHLFQRLATCLWRGNAAMWVNRQPTVAPQTDGVL